MSSYIPIYSQALSASASSINFNNIPTTKNGRTIRDLVLVMQAGATANSNWYVRFNGDTGSSYNYIILGGNGTTIGATTSSSLTYFFPNYFDTLDNTLNYQASLHMLDFAKTDKNKTVLTRTNKPGNGISAGAARWASVNAITSITITVDVNQFIAGSRFALYGIEG